MRKGRHDPVGRCHVQQLAPRLRGKCGIRIKAEACIRPCRMDRDVVQRITHDHHLCVTAGDMQHRMAQRVAGCVVQGQAGENLATCHLPRAVCIGRKRAACGFEQFYKPLLEPLGLTYPQYLVILSLHAQDDRTVSQLSAELGLESNTLSPLLKRMAQAGQVMRMRAIQDERMVRVTLTDAGRAVAAKAAMIPQCIQACVDIPPDDLMAAATLLGQLRHILETTPTPALP